MFSSSYIIKAIDQFTPTAFRISQGFDKISNKAERAANSTGRFSRAMSKMSTAQAIATGSVGYYVFNTLKDFSEQMQGVKSVAEVTGVSFAELEEQAKELGRTTRYTASQAASAQYFLAKAGYDTKKIYDAMPQTLLLASAANLDIAQSADIVTNIMAGYQMNTEQLTEAVDVLSKSFSSSNTDLVDLGTAMKYAGPVASGMGISFKEAAAAIGMMGNAGIQGSMAGTSLRGALVRLAKPTKEVKRYIKGLKLDIYNSNGSIKSLTEIVEQLEKRGATTAHMMAIFGQRAGPAMSALVSQGSAELRKFQQTLDNSTGFAAKAAKTRMEGFYGMWEELKSAAEGFVHAVGDVGFTNILIGLGKTITWLINLFSGLLNIITKISKFTGGAIGEAFGDAASWIRRKFAGDDGLLQGDKLAEAQEKLRLLQQNSGELAIKIEVVDKGNNTGKIEAAPKSLKGAWEHLKLDVGRSSRGE